MTARNLLRSARVRILASYLSCCCSPPSSAGIALRERAARPRGRARGRRSRAGDGGVPQAGSRRARSAHRAPFGDDVEAIFDVFLSRNVPGEGEAFFTFVRGNPYRASFAPRVRSLRVSQIEEVARSPGTSTGEFEADDGRRIRYLSVPVRIDRRQRGTFLVTIDLSGEIDEVNDDAEVAPAWPSGCFLLASVLAWVVAGRVLAPLRVLRDTARSIGETDLTRRIPVEGDDELADLARTFNEMLDRLELAFASQKAFISDAGHELRTPITIVRGHLELLDDDPDERRETLELVTDELDRMTRLVNDLLLLAKAQRPDFLQPETIDVSDFTRDLFAKASALAQRDWRLAHVAAGRDRRGPPAAHPGGDEPERERRGSHRRGRRRGAWLGRGGRLAGSCGSVTPARAWRRLTATGSSSASSAAGRRGRREPVSASPSPRPLRRRTAAASSSTAHPVRRRALHPDDPDRTTPGGGPTVNRILIAEDEPRLASFLEKGLRANGFVTTIVADGVAASMMARDDDFDLLVLDLGLPGRDGTVVLREMRAAGQRMPVLILTARDDVSDKVGGLEGGADDYVTKPFRFEELLARIRARLRDERTMEPTVLAAGDLTLDLRTRRANTQGRSIDLTAREFTMLEVMIRHGGQVLSREQLLSHVWGYDYDPGSNVVDVYVGYLRKKLGPGSIETVRGMGYRLPT